MNTRIEKLEDEIKENSKPITLMFIAYLSVPFFIAYIGLIGVSFYYFDLGKPPRLLLFFSVPFSFVTPWYIRSRRVLKKNAILQAKIDEIRSEEREKANQSVSRVFAEITAKIKKIRDSAHVQGRIAE